MDGSPRAARSILPSERAKERDDEASSLAGDQRTQSRQKFSEKPSEGRIGNKHNAYTHLWEKKRSEGDDWMMHDCDLHDAPPSISIIDMLTRRRKAPSMKVVYLVVELVLIRKASFSPK